MPWSGSSFSRNTGVYTGATAWAQTDGAARGIRSDDHDTHDQDLADGINACLKKDGNNAATADLDIGGFKLTNVADGVSDGDAVNKGQLDAVSGVSLSGTNTFTGSNTFSAGATIGDASGDVVVIKGTTVNSFMSGLFDKTNGSGFLSGIGATLTELTTAPQITLVASAGTYYYQTPANLLKTLTTTGGAGFGVSSKTGFTGTTYVLAKDDNGPKWCVVTV